MSSIKQGFFSNLKNDFPASIVVFLVALPLCLGIALASGAPLFSGLIAGIVGGTVVALMSGSPLGVSGPAAGLAAIVITAIPELGGFETFLLAVIVGGIIQLILGFIKAGIIGYYFPNSVIKGMLSAIGIIIILKQIPHAFGYDKDPEGDLNFFQPDGQTTISELFNMVDYISPGAVIIAVLSLAILILWERPFMKKISLFNIIQGPLIVVVLGIILNLVFEGTSLMISKDHLVSIPVAESIEGFFGQFTTPDFTQLGNPKVYLIGATMAIVASLETLLCVEATDKLDPEKRITPTNRELLAQGTGNIVSGFIGGLPITQVIVRSSANIQSGGKTKASAFIHGVLLLVSVISIPFVLNLIPLASLAAILFVVGFKLAKPALFKQLYKMGHAQFVPFIITVIGIVFTDLLVGIGIGFAVAIFYILYNNYKIPYHFDPETYKAGDPVVIELSEEVSFLNKGSILQTLNHLPNNTKVTIDGRKTRSIHPDVVEIIEDFQQNGMNRGIELTCLGMDDKVHLNPVAKFQKAMKETESNL